MEKKNNVLLIAIFGAALLVFVVGATFAYFTASNSQNGDGSGNIKVDTAIVGASLILNVNKINGSNNIFYPGTKNFVGATASATFAEDSSVIDKIYNVSYILNGSVTLTETFASPVNWTLYETETDVSTGLITCGAVTEYIQGGDAVEGSKTQSCTLAPSLANDATKAVKSGSIAAGTSIASISYNGTVTTGGDTKYYYLVVELPETGENQSLDATGKTINIAIDKIEQTGASIADVETISLNFKTINLQIGDSKAVVATVNGTDNNVVWSSNNEEVATVNNDGVITGLKEGKAIISATVGGKSASVEVNVKLPTSACTYGDASYNSSYILSVDLTQDGCAVNPNGVYNEIDTIVAREYAKAVNELAAMGFSNRDMEHSEKYVSIKNTADTGLVGIQITMTITVIDSANPYVVMTAEYIIKSDGSRQMIRNDINGFE